ncbi:sigma-54-dependent Fis family transcriptional regulator [Planctomycetales bacterium ZRK34]|nr:sigma-54-dependent Fis family transcriptional regulator [Planctomycetales bacterium ZRK34]
MTQPEEQLTAQVLLVDDEVSHAEVMAEALKRLGHVCTIVHDSVAAADELRHGTFDVIVTDLVMDSEEAGMKVLEEAKKTQPNAEVIMVTAHGDVPTAKAALRGGAYDFIEKPLDLDVFRNLVNRAAQTVLLRSQNTELRQQVDDRFGLEGIIGTSSAMQRVLTTVRQVAASDIPVLITGESGTGKELIAGAIHRNSPRAKKAFKPLNCAGLSASILESELFGHIKGSFTGAERDRQGVFEYADGGTLFLDEIGDMPVDMQAKLLRVLESGEVVRVGDNEPRHVNVRLISATNHDLQKLIKDGKFREDLFFRIRGAHIQLPSLRQRREDIPLLVRHFVTRFANAMNKTVIGIAEPAQLALMQYHWPGNVRELLNVVQNMVVVAGGEQLELADVPAEIRAAGEAEGEDLGSLAGLSLEQIEKQAIRNTLRMTGGNREQAAKLLNIGERTLYRKLKEYGLK